MTAGNLNDCDAPSGTGGTYTQNGTLYTYAGGSVSGARVQEAVASHSFAVTLGVAPTNGNWLVALGHAGIGSSLGGIPAANTGWTSLGTHAPVGGDVLDVYARLVYRQAGSGEIAAQTPFSSTADGTCGVSIIEISGLGSDFLAALSGWTMDSPPNSGFGSLTLTETTTHASTFAVAFACFSGAGSAATLTLSGTTWTNQVHAENASSSSNSERVGSAIVEGVGQTITETITPSFSTYSFAGALLTFGSGTWNQVATTADVLNTVGVTATEALAANALINLYSGGMRNADATLGYEAHGFVTSAVLVGGSAVPQPFGKMTGLSGLSIGPVYLGSAGAITSTPPSAPALLQQVGLGLSSTQAFFLPQTTGFGRV